MAFTENLVEHLETYAGLTALVAERVFPIQLPQDAELPAVTYQRISNVHEQPISMSVVASGVRLQCMCFASTYLSARAVATQVKAALGTFTDNGNRFDFELATDFDDLDPLTRTYWVMVEAVLYTKGDA